MYGLFYFRYIYFNVIITAMKLTFNKYWIFVSICIIANIIIFIFLSKSLEHLVYNDILSREVVMGV